MIMDAISVFISAVVATKELFWSVPQLMNYIFITAQVDAYVNDVIKMLVVLKSHCWSNNMTSVATIHCSVGEHIHAKSEY